MRQIEFWSLGPGIPVHFSANIAKVRIFSTYFSIYVFLFFLNESANGREMRKWINKRKKNSLTHTLEGRLTIMITKFHLE